MTTQMLRKGGTVLTHDDLGHVAPKKLDLLIQDSSIANIEEDVSTRRARVVDCTGKIVSPDFVDTHHHTWQTQLMGAYADGTLLKYFPTG
ncbi:uncharacterized protein Z518_09600 [Rhinocladiella mackenziei CBS 650.93]|uniref:Uncharacterized protein n=1 Tax=Rhinocladiella mackenziei CBS 650.93 TaxID=1442369 RepID=A0A0D2GU80_9EURO|nr:uncharacterized protein Z518_09600 [Rhinocladiella mackenziei CBS 650.93]KIX01873.1 hypothetical protein Z518_09600 [Rhinocladiella mackenziei CBS 650.93]